MHFLSANRFAAKRFRWGKASRGTSMRFNGDNLVYQRLTFANNGTRREPFNFTPHGGQSDFVWLSARTPHGANV